MPTRSTALPSLCALAFGLLLTGCAAPAPVAPAPPGQTSGGLVPMPQTGQTTSGTIATPASALVSTVTTGRDERAAARSFVEVVDRVEPVAEAECRARAPRLNCDFRIVVDDRPGTPPNAFQTLDAAGRPILAITLGLIVDVQNPDELAFIIAHEAAHHIQGHLEQQRQNAIIGATVFGRLAGTAGTATPEAIRAAQELGAAVGARSYSQDFELEADALGTVITARAGYDPVRGAEYFWRIPDPGDRFLGTHPPNAARVAVVRQTAAGLGL